MKWIRRHGDAAVSGVPDPDELAIAELVANGAAIDVPRSIQHYLLTTTESAARTATLQLFDAGYESSITENPTAPGWIVVAEHVDRLDGESIALCRSLMELIAGRLPSGTYDGWRAELLDDEDAFEPFDTTSLDLAPLDPAPSDLGSPSHPGA